MQQIEAENERLRLLRDQTALAYAATPTWDSTWTKRMLAKVTEPSATLYQLILSGHVLFGQPALQHRDRSQEIVASGSQISGKDRVRSIGEIGDTRPLLLLLDIGAEKLNAPTQISDQRLQFPGAAGLVQ